MKKANFFYGKMKVENDSLVELSTDCDTFTIEIPKDQIKNIFKVSKSITCVAVYSEENSLLTTHSSGFRSGEKALFTSEFLLTNDISTFAIDPKTSGNLIDQFQEIAKKYKDEIKAISTVASIVSLGVSYLEYQQREEIIRQLKAVIARLDSLEKNILNAISEQTLTLLTGELKAGILELKEATTLIEENDLDDVPSRLKTARRFFSKSDGLAEAFLIQFPDYISTNKTVFLWFEIIKFRSQVLSMEGNHSLIAPYVENSIEKIRALFIPNAKEVFSSQYQLFDDNAPGDPTNPFLYRIIYRGNFSSPVLFQATYEQCQYFINQKWESYRQETWENAINELLLINSKLTSLR